MRMTLSKSKIIFISLTFAISLSGCNAAERMSRIGKEPNLAAINNPTHARGYRPVDLPMPSETLSEKAPNSLWRAGARAFFKDQRASKIGDILTVKINFKTEGALNNESSNERSSSEKSRFAKFFGADNLVQTITNSNNELIDFGTPESKYKGNGKIKRDEEIKNLDVAALITQILPNRNFVIHAKQQIRVNHEMREILLSGIVRPEDIDTSNQVPLDKIAEARISYGGKGQLSDVQQPRYGQQLFDILFPY